MKTLILIVLTFFTTASYAIWKPSGYHHFSAIEKKIIDAMVPIRQQNKTYVQLLLDIGRYQNCALGTALTDNGIYLTVIDLQTSEKYRYVLNLKRSLMSGEAYSRLDIPMYVLVFDQQETNETIFMYFMLSKRGRISSMKIVSKINHRQGIPLISKYIGKVERGYEIVCIGIEQ